MSLNMILKYYVLKIREWGLYTNFRGIMQSSNYPNIELWTKLHILNILKIIRS